MFSDGTDSFKSKDRKNRRSSILKPVLNDVDQNTGVLFEETDTRIIGKTRKSRRVSFAETLQVKEFQKDNAKPVLKVNENTGKSSKNLALFVPERQHSPPQKYGSNLQTTSNTSINRYRSFTTTEPAFSAASKSVESAGTIQDVNKTRIFDGGDEDFMEMTQVHNADIQQPQLKERNSAFDATWANQSTKVFSRSVIDDVDLGDGTMDFTTCVGGVINANNTISDVLSSTKSYGMDTTVQDKDFVLKLSPVFRDKHNDLSIVAGSSDVNLSDEGKIDAHSFLKNLFGKKEELKPSQVDTVSSSQTIYMDENMEMTTCLPNKQGCLQNNKTILPNDDMDFTAGVSDSLVAKMMSGIDNASILNPDNMDFTCISNSPVVKLDSKSALSRLMNSSNKSSSLSQDEKLNNNKLDHGLSSQPEKHGNDTFYNTVVTSDIASPVVKIDSKGFLSSLFGNKGSGEKYMDSGNPLTRSSVVEPVQNSSTSEKSLSSVHQQSSSEVVSEYDINFNGVVNSASLVKETTVKNESSTQLLQQQRKGLSDITHVFNADESMSNMEHTTCVGGIENQNNKTVLNQIDRTVNFQMDDLSSGIGRVEETECVGGILNSAAAAAARAANKSVCFNLEENTVHKFDIIDSQLSFDHLEQMSNINKSKIPQIQGGITKQVDVCNKTVIFSSDDNMVEETTCVGNIIQGKDEISTKLSCSEDKVLHLKTGETSHVQKSVGDKTGKTGMSYGMDKTVVFNEFERTHLDGAIEETVCVGGIRAVAGAHVNELQSLPTVNGNKTIIFSELNKTSSVGIEETVCVGGIKHIADLSSAELPDNKKNNKTIMFVDDEDKTNGCFMEETACVGGISNISVPVSFVEDRNSSSDLHVVEPQNNSDLNETVAWTENAHGHAITKLSTDNNKALLPRRFSDQDKTLEWSEKEKSSIEGAPGVFVSTRKNSNNSNIVVEAFTSTEENAGKIRHHTEKEHNFSNMINHQEHDGDIFDEKEVTFEDIPMDSESDHCERKFNLNTTKTESVKGDSSQVSRNEIWDNKDMYLANKTTAGMDYMSVVAQSPLQALRAKLKRRSSVMIPPLQLACEESQQFVPNSVGGDISYIDVTKCGDITSFNHTQSAKESVDDTLEPERIADVELSFHQESQAVEKVVSPCRNTDSEKHQNVLLDLKQDLDLEDHHISSTTLSDSLMAEPLSTASFHRVRSSSVANLDKIDLTMDMGDFSMISLYKSNSPVTSKCVSVSLPAEDDLVDKSTIKRKSDMTNNFDNTDMESSFKKSRLTSDDDYLNFTEFSHVNPADSSKEGAFGSKPLLSRTITNGTKSTVGDISLIPKPSTGLSISRVSVVEDYNLSSYNAKTVEDYLRHFGVNFQERKVRRSTLAPVSVRPAEGTSEALQLVIYEPQIVTYEWACEQFNTLSEKCKEMISEIEAKLMANIPEILLNKPGDIHHIETSQKLAHMKMLCRKKARTMYKDWKCKMNKSVGVPLKQEEQVLSDGIQEISLATDHTKPLINELNKVQLELVEKEEITVKQKKENVNNSAQILEKEKHKEELKAIINSLEKDRTELIKGNKDLKDQLRCVGSHVHLDAKIQEKRRNRARYKAKLEYLTCCAPCTVSSWDDNKAVFGLLDENLHLTVVFGKHLERVWFNETPHRDISSVYLESRLKFDEHDPKDLAIQMGLRFLMQHFPSDMLLQECPDTTQLSAVMHRINLVVCETSALIRTLVKFGLSSVHNTRYDFQNNSITLIVSTMKAWRRFQLTFLIKANHYPSNEIEWNFTNHIGNTKKEDIETLFKNVKPGFNYLKHLIYVVYEYVKEKERECIFSKQDQLCS